MLVGFFRVIVRYSFDVVGSVLILWPISPFLEVSCWLKIVVVRLSVHSRTTVLILKVVAVEPGIVVVIISVGFGGI